MRGIANPSPPPFFANKASNFHIPAQTSSFNRNSRSDNEPPVYNFFGLQTATWTREKVKEKKNTQIVIDDALYELPENPDLELGDGLIENLRITAEDLFQVDSIIKKEEAIIFEKTKEEYGFEDIKEAFDEGRVPENIYFFYVWESENFYQALEFVGLSPINREFGAFLMSHLGRQVMTQNKLSVHVESGAIFYENHNAGENFYNFLFAQQNDDAAFIPEKVSYSNTNFYNAFQ